MATLVSITIEQSNLSIVAMEQLMTLEFLDGIIVALTPSMLVVAWLVWRIPSDEHLSDEL